tara:strand:- start:1463 stop:3238 length:1776 start_codon:yes stop_codon:yes gene_type:complete
MREKSLVYIIVILVAVTTPVTSVSAAPPTEEAEFYYGVEYDWNSVNPDIENFTGLDLPEFFAEIMGAANDAGFELIIGQINTGSSNVYVHYTEDVTPRTIQDINGQDVDVWSRTTDVTLRHGGLVDGVFMTEWSETKETFGSQETKIDIDASTSIQNMLNVDMVFTEYLNNDYDLVGADMEFSMETQLATGLSIDALFKGDGESLPIDFDFGMSYGYSITDSTSQWRLQQPDSVYKDISENENYYWHCPDCGTLTGDYDGSIDYSVELTGIPTEEFGLDQGEFDIEISDEITKSNKSYDATMEAEFEYVSGNEMTVDLGNGDGLTTTVQTCETCPPGNPVMFMMMGNVIAGASQAFAEEIVDEFSENLSGDLTNIFGLGEEDGNDTEEESDEPSEKIMEIVEAIIDSNLGEVMEDFGENLNSRMETIEPLEEFPYTDGMWAPMWSNQYAAVVGVGVYVMDDNGAYTMAGPETSGYSSSNLPATMSIRYLTGTDANTAAEDMEDADELSDIVDVNQHDLSQITQDLEDAGIDTSGLDIETPNLNIDNDEDSNQETEAEEKINADGLLPFVSPFAVLVVIALAGIVFGNRKNE